MTNMAANPTPIIPTAIANPRDPYVACPLDVPVAVLVPDFEAVPVAAVPVAPAAVPVAPDVPEAVSVADESVAADSVPVADPVWVVAPGVLEGVLRGVPDAVVAAVAVGVPMTTVDVPSTTRTETDGFGPPWTISNCWDSARIPLFWGVLIALKRIR
jgi:hypothetical protein